METRLVGELERLHQRVAAMELGRFYESDILSRNDEGEIRADKIRWVAYIQSKLLEMWKFFGYEQCPVHRGNYAERNEKFPIRIVFDNMLQRVDYEISGPLMSIDYTTLVPDFDASQVSLDTEFELLVSVRDRTISFRPTMDVRRYSCIIPIDPEREGFIDLMVIIHGLFTDKKRREYKNLKRIEEARERRRVRDEPWVQRYNNDNQPALTEIFHKMIAADMKKMQTKFAGEHSGERLSNTDAEMAIHRLYDDTIAILVGETRRSDS